jgi:hypothetical protein
MLSRIANVGVLLVAVDRLLSDGPCSFIMNSLHFSPSFSISWTVNLNFLHLDSYKFDALDS